MATLVRFAPIAFLAAAAALTAPASAAPVSRSVVVRHTDLDLTTARGVAELQRRIVRAARKVCGASDPLDLAAQPDVLACRTATLAQAEPEIEVAVTAAGAGGAQLAAANVPSASHP